MAWIELHQSLWSHRKTLVLAGLLGLDNPIYAAAHMAHLWCWAIDNAPDGDLSGLPAAVIAYGAGWRGDPEQFVQAAVTAGFLDREGDTLRIHDWDDYAGAIAEQHRQEMRRKRELRRAYSSGIIDAVRQRDGDRCRYCGRQVNWRNRRGLTGGTYDQVDPNGGATIDNLVVCCRGCANRKAGRTLAEAGMALLPPPHEDPIKADADGWGYVESILDSWASRGITTVEEARAEVDHWRRRRRHMDKLRDLSGSKPGMSRGFESLMRLMASGGDA